MPRRRNGLKELKVTLVRSDQQSKEGSERQTADVGTATMEVSAAVAKQSSGSSDRGRSAQRRGSWVIAGSSTCGMRTRTPRKVALVC